MDSQQNKEQAPRRDRKVERAIRQHAASYGGDPLWAVRRPGESDADCIERLAQKVEAQHARVCGDVA